MRSQTSFSFKIRIGVLILGLALIWTLGEAQAFQPTGRQSLLSNPPQAGQAEIYELPRTVITHAPATDSEVVSALEQYFYVNPELTAGTGPFYLQLSYLTRLPATALRPEIIYVQFVQQVTTLPLIGSYIHGTLKNVNGEIVLVALRGQVYPEMSSFPTSPPPLFDPFAIAEETLGLSMGACDAGTSQTYIRFIFGRWREILDVTCPGESLHVLIERQTKKAVTEDQGHYLTTGTVHGPGHRTFPMEPLDDLELGHLLLIPNEGDFRYTDAEGNFSLTDADLPPTLDLTLTLVGRYAYLNSYSPIIVNDENNMNEKAFVDDLMLSVTLTRGGAHDFLFELDATDELTRERGIAQINGYYHTTLIHDWVQERIPTGLPPLFDQPLTVQVNEFDTDIRCNAQFLAPASIHFAQSDFDCANTAIDTIIYHEYGHYLDEMAGRIPMTFAGGGLGEGWGDVFAAYVSGQPLLGQGLDKDSGTGWRTAENDYQLGPDEIHDMGQAWAGFAWRVRKAMIDRYGQAEGTARAEDLVIPTLLANAQDIPDAVMEVMLADEDDDLNPVNGTLHSGEIMDAAFSHRIPLRMFARISDPQEFQIIALADTPYTVRGTVAAEGLDNYQLFSQKVTFDGNESPVQQLTPPLQGPLDDGPIGGFAPVLAEPGIYGISLLATMPDGRQFEDYVTVHVENFRMRRVTAPKDSFFDMAGYSKADIDGDWVVWIAKENLSLRHRVGGFNLLTGEEREIASGIEGDFGDFGADVEYFEYSDIVIEDPWVAFRTWSFNSTISSISLYNLQTQETLSIEHDPIPESLAISDGRLVWFEDTQGEQLWTHDISTGVTEVLLGGAGLIAVDSSLDIDGRSIVWAEWPGKVRIYDLVDKTTKELDNDSVESLGLKIQGNRVARMTSDKLFLYELPGGEKRQLTDIVEPDFTSGVYTAMDFDGDLIVWADGRTDDADDVSNIYAYDLVPGAMVEITNNIDLQDKPAVSGNRIIAVDFRFVPDFFSSNIFLYEYQRPPAGVPFVRGDANEDGALDIGDPLFILFHNFLGQGNPSCLDALDVDDDGALDVNDAIYLLYHLFLEGEAPPAPYPDPGIDPTPDPYICQ